MAGYGHRGKRLISYNAVQNIAIWYNTILSQKRPPYLTTTIIRPVRRSSIACRLLHLLDASMGCQWANASRRRCAVEHSRQAVMVWATGQGRSMSRTGHKPPGINHRGCCDRRPTMTVVRDTESTASIDRVTTAVPPVVINSLDKGPELLAP